MQPAWFIDFEASSLSKESYPIEVGIAKLDFHSGEIISDGFLIAPEKSWFDWNPESEKIHGIPRVDCIQNGKPTSLAAEVLNTMLGGELIFCDAPSFDGHWNRRLFEAAGVKPAFRITSIWDIIMGFIPDDGPQDIDMLVQWRVDAGVILATPNPHRAEADARLLASSVFSIKNLLDTRIAELDKG